MGIWRGQKATISIDKDGTSITVGILQDVEIETSRNIEELFGAGSIKRQDEQQTELSINVSATVAEWDVAGLQDLMDYDSTNTEISDTSDVPTFEISGTFTDSSGTQLDFTVTGVYFEDLPVGGDKDDWLEIELNGTGDDISTLSSPA